MTVASAPFDVRQTREFARWFAGLRDGRTRAHVVSRIDRLALGLIGDARSVGGGVSELRIHSGPGYRLYFTRQGDRVILLLCGGDKSSQRADIARAREIVATETDDAT